jgi:hypothetical protein
VSSMVKCHEERIHRRLPQIHIYCVLAFGVDASECHSTAHPYQIPYIVSAPAMGKVGSASTVSNFCE